MRHLIIFLLLISSKGWAKSSAIIENQLDSIVISFDLSWDQIEKEFSLYAQRNYKVQNFNDFLEKFNPEKPHKGSKKYVIDKKSKYENLHKLGKNTNAIFSNLENVIGVEIKKNKWYKSANAGTYTWVYSQFFCNYPFNHYRPNHFTQILLWLKTDLNNDQLFEKFALIALSKKIFYDNNFHETPKSLPQKSNASLTVQTPIPEKMDAEVEPQFIGGEEIMVRFLMLYLFYPKDAIIMGDKGIVYVQYVINKDGSISNIVVRKGVSNTLDKEAVRVVSLMPNWMPGIQNGKYVRVRFTIPIQFNLD